MEQGLKYQRTKETFEARPVRSHRLVPSKRLIARLGLHDFDKPAPMTEVEMNPEVVYVSTRQHVGAPAESVVTVGQKVQQGELIGKIPENSLGAGIHASISGTVVESGNDYIAIRRA